MKKKKGQKRANICPVAGGAPTRRMLGLKARIKCVPRAA